jgi:hypothetical protein
MKKRLLIFILSFFTALFSQAQNTPVFIDTTYEDAGAMGPDEIITWSYKGYKFVSETPGIARPFPFNSIHNSKTGKIVQNSQIFNSNIEALINQKIKEKFSTENKISPECFKESFYHYVDFNNFQIRVDKENMYFLFLWHNFWPEIIEGKSYCDIFIYTEISIPIKEIDKLIKNI